MVLENALDVYFNTYRYQMFFFDILMKESDKTKEKILSELSIPYSSFSRAYDCNSAKTKNIMEKLSNYFNIKLLKKEDHIRYKEVFRNAIYSFYYCNDNIDELLDSINGIIEENNYLFPLFELIKLLLLLTRYKISRVRNLEMDDEIACLRRYESMFIGTDLEYFYRYLIIVGSDKKYQLEYDESSDIDDEYGLLFYAYMINSYFNADYESVICYYIELKHPLLKYQNLKRYSYASIFYLSALNNLGRFKKCAAKGRLNLISTKYSNAAMDTFEATLVIYMLACLGLSQYEYVLDKYYELNSYRKKLLPHALIAARKLNRLDIYNNLLNDDADNITIVKAIRGFYEDEESHNNIYLKKQPINIATRKIMLRKS